MLTPTQWQETCDLTSALASTVHENGQYQIIYDSVKDAEGGFPSIWGYWPRLATEVISTLSFHGHSLDSVDEYIDSVSWLIERVYHLCSTEGRLPLPHETSEIVRTYVRTFTEETQP